MDIFNHPLPFDDQDACPDCDDKLCQACRQALIDVLEDQAYDLQWTPKESHEDIPHSH